MSKIQSVQKFRVEIGGKIHEFDSEVEAKEALAKEALRGRAEAYTTARGLEGKNAAARQNVILDFLAYEAGQEETEEVAE